MQIRRRASTFAFIRLRIGSGNIKSGAGPGVHGGFISVQREKLFI
jgi:hypothetical protein